jgi:DNA-directed RNA polymerase specialized sigma24 family protein
VNEDDERLKDIEAKLEVVIKLLALNIVSDESPLRENALRLQRAGLAPRDIAALCDTTPNTVSVLLSTAKRDSKRRKVRNRRT